MHSTINPMEECQRKAENMLRFFAMEPLEQAKYLGNLPHDHGKPGYSENAHVIRFQRLVDNFLESDPALMTGHLDSGIERDMQYLLNHEIGESKSEQLWSEHGLNRHSMWRILRILAREALSRGGVTNIPPTVGIDELCSR